MVSSAGRLLSVISTRYNSTYYSGCVATKLLKRLNSSGTGPALRYEQLVKEGKLRADDYQRTVVAKLQALHNLIESYTPPEIPEPASHHLSWLDRLRGKEPPSSEVPEIPEHVPKGMYLYGDVGCGKTMLMDLFYETLPKNVEHSKRRAHFHAFMEDVHKRNHKMVQENMAGQDAIVPIARQLAKEARILCFDEFQVLDIVDAMILRRLMESLIGYGVVCVITSNRKPDDLYKNGIQRASFIPCIDLIKERFIVEDLDSGLDYRKVPRALSKVYFDPITPENRAEMDKLFVALTSASGEPVSTTRTLTVWGRPLKIPESTSKIARFHFKQLCGEPLSASDYLEITRNFDTIFVTDIPRLTTNERDLARRFILFIDSCYESRTKLFCLSDPPVTQIMSDAPSPTTEISDAMRAAMDDLGLTADVVGASSIFSSDEEIFAFARAVSRLSEMGTQFWAEQGSKNTEHPLDKA